jgi:hypothetical protein
MLAVVVVMSAAPAAECEAQGRARGCAFRALGQAPSSALSAHVEGALSEGAPKPRPGPRQKPKCTKATSPVWQDLKPYRGSIKTNGETGRRARYYQWDHTHGDIEMYDHRGRHMGSVSPDTGRIIKGAVKGRTIEL